jgi:hypothetical protein
VLRLTQKLLKQEVREVANNFGGIPQMRDEYFELQREIYK